MEYEVTIGIPVYNIEKYIRLTMDSALAQTFPSIEFLVCDDCGTDGSIDIVREYQRSHPRGSDIRILRQPRNMGIGEGRNRMMAEARGRYFYSLDGDDAIVPETIELLYRTACEYRAEIVYGSYERVYVADGEPEHRVQYPYPHLTFEKPDEYAVYVYNHPVQVMNWNFLIDIDIIRRNGLKVTPVGHGYGEDFTFTVDLPTYITRAVLLPAVTYQYYIRTSVIQVKRRKLLSREQMMRSVAAIDAKKRRSELKSKPYYARRCATLMMYDFSFACQMACRRHEAEPPFTDREIRAVMWHPMSLGEILCSRHDRLKNLGYYLFGVLPPALSVFLMKRLTKK